MWLILCLALAGQADDILADEARGGAPTVVAPAAASDASPAGPPSGPITSDKAETAPPAEAAPTQAGENADDTEAPAQSGLGKMLSDLGNSGAMFYMIQGGLFMWPLLFMGIVALGVIIERSRALLLLGTRQDELRTEVRGLLECDEIEQALTRCEESKGPVPAILGAGLKKYLIARRLGYDAAKIEEQVVKGMDDYSVHVVAALEKHLPILATISSAAPMIGFLGTVQGMVVAFDDIVKHMGEKNIVEAAAGGIMVSLLTTVMGLLVGIPAYVAFNYFTSVTNRFVLEVEESASELIEAVTFQLAMSSRSVHETPESASLPPPVAAKSHS
jgi:biopolymer transport protein ExbB